MSVFFSGTDWSELNDNCPQHNIYLSVIVNNYNDIIGKIAFTAQPSSFTCKNIDGKDYTLSISGAKMSPLMFVYDCDIIHRMPQLGVPDSFKERMNVIIKKAENKPKTVYGSYGNDYYKEQPKKDLSKIPATKLPSQKSFSKFDKKLEQSEFLADIENGVAETEDFEYYTLEEEFALYVLRLGNILEDDSIDAALIDAEASEIPAEVYCQSILDSYGAYHDSFFEKIKKKQTDEAFLETLEDVIVTFEYYADAYPFLELTIDRLRALGNRYDKTVKEVTHG